jgi:hypothetical protein
MACDLVELNRSLEERLNALDKVLAQQCGDQGDVGDCLKRRAGAAGALHAEITALRNEIQICSALRGYWEFDAFDPSGGRLAEDSAGLFVRSWDPASFVLTGSVILHGGHGYKSENGTLIASFTPIDLGIDVFLYDALPDGGGRQQKLAYVGKLNGLPYQPLTAGSGFLEPANLGTWKVRKTFIQYGGPFPF